VSRRSSSSNPEIPAPSAFYFPTKETERHLDRKVKTTDNSADQENRFFRSTARQAAKKKGMRKKIIKKMTACLDEKQQDNGVPPVKQKPHLVQAKLPVAQVVRRKSSNSTKADNVVGKDRNVPLLKFKQDATEKKSSKHERKSSIIEEEPEEKNTSMPSAMLHAEEDYFNRLSMSPSSLPAASPFVASSNRVTAILDKPSNLNSYPAQSPANVRVGSKGRSSMPTTAALDTTMDMAAMTPMSQLVKDDDSDDSFVDSEVDTPVSDLFSSSSSVPDMRHNQMPSMRYLKTDASPVSSLMRFYTKSGPMGSSPQSYNSDDFHGEAESQDLGVFDDGDDEQSSSSNQTALSEEEDEVPSDREEGRSAKKESIESQSSLYTIDSKLYETSNPEKKLQTLVHEEKTLSKDISFSLPKEKPVASTSLALVENSAEDAAEDHLDVDEPQVSKLESLFRPILPALSTDDAQSVFSYDHREIKVTESAPGAIQASRYISLAGRKSSLSSTSQHRNGRLVKQDPSRVSLDSQPSPSQAMEMVSNQAENNAEFLFASDQGPTLIAGDPARARQGGSVSISTGGARSRLTQRSVQAKDVKMSQKSFDEEESRSTEVRSVSSQSYKSERRVRFSTEVEEGKSRRVSVVSISSSQQSSFDHIDASSETEGRVSDMTESIATSVRRSSGIVSLRSVGDDKMEPVKEEDENCDVSPVRTSGNWGYKDGNATGVTPHLKGKALKNATNSPFLRFQEAKGKFDNKVVPSSSFAESIDLPEIQSKVSDLTDAGSVAGRKSSETLGSLQSSRSIPEPIPEEEEVQLELSPENSIHWTYNENGVTPYVKGKPVENATKSPVLRFNDAKTKFSSTVVTKSPQNVASIVRRRSSVSTKNPKPTKAIVKKGSGGLVSARIEELNARVTEVRKIKRMRKKQTNPRLHTHNFDNKQPVRNRALLNYKTSMNNADMEKCNTYMAAKFNVIPDVDVEEDESPLSGSKFSLDPSPTNSVISHLTSGTNGTNDTEETGRTEGTGATVVQTRDTSTIRYRSSESTISSASSSGFSNVRKQVLFRPSDGTKSLSSNDESTTMSAVLRKENEFFPPAALHLSPVQKTPMQAMKWRSLAVAAAQNDGRSAKKSAKKKVLGSRSNNQKNVFKSRLQI
ncbi:MAG: hypothetical protein SGILL_003412, partial [Bacillariaceae sp.]